MINVIRIESRGDLARAFEVREEVFDQFEEASVHFLVRNESNEPVGTARWRTTRKGVKLGRFAVRKSWRGKGFGAALVKAVLEDLAENFNPGELLYLHAQFAAVSLYEKFGFVKKGEQFQECDMWHYEMERLL